jgi:short-subunit dehydrogenase
MNVGSGAGEMGIPTINMYCSTKAYDNVFANMIALGEMMKSRHGHSYYSKHHAVDYLLVKPG